MARITDRFVKEIVTPARGYVLERDDDLTGFGVRRTASGCTAFVFSYAIEGRERRLTIGRYPAWSVAAAREEAKRLRRKVDLGTDPMASADAQRIEPRLHELWARYRSDVLPRKAMSTQRNEAAMWTRHILPEFGSYRLSQITPAAIERFHLRLTSRTPVLANRCLASLQHVFVTAVRWRVISASPGASISKNREEGRDRYLSPVEYQRFAAALDSRRETPSTLAILFLLQTGARRGEVLSATWEQFDLDRAIWVKPSSHTKQRRVHRVPLSGPALETLRRAKAFSDDEYVFPGRSGRPLVEVKKVFAAVLREAEIDNFRIHDLRHSFASFLVADGASLPIIGQLLGHTQVSTTQRYAHLHDEPLRQATNRIWLTREHHGQAESASR